MANNTIGIPFEKGYTPWNKSDLSHMYKTRFYRIWTNMKSRCGNPNVSDYKRYGGRGIRVCKEWQSFRGFFNDMYPTYKDGLTIERKQNDLGYSRSNCTWANAKEQANNRVSSRFLTWKGVRQTLAQWAEYLGMKSSTLRQRYYVYEWPVNKCFTYPIRERRV